jgi:putative aminopeptidase FrvX
MLAAHADEIAMAVNYIDDDGFIYVRKMGGVDAAITKAQRVVIHTRNGPVKGVVGNVAPHLMKRKATPSRRRSRPVHRHRRQQPQGRRETGPRRRPDHADGRV